MIIKYSNETGQLVDINQSNEQQGIVISPANLQSLETIYGAYTDACRSRIINDLIRDAINKIEDKSRCTN